MRAVEKVMGQKRCLYHLTQATWRKIQDLGLRQLYPYQRRSKDVCFFLIMSLENTLSDIAA